ncbi:MAG: indole-3-glycerol-phosphate synthase [Pseudomonadota bacterium]
MSDFLRTMLRSSERRHEHNIATVSLKTLETQIETQRRPSTLVLDPQFSLIAEIKGRSPAEGALADGETLDRVAQANAYASGGASAISVLTEPERFDGSLTHLEDVSDSLTTHRVPAMRKDFLCSEYQVFEAAAHGAGGVLLITAMLSDSSLAAMLNVAEQCHLFVLVECFDAEDIQRSLAVLSQPSVQALIDRGQLMLGINTRNLRTLAVDDTRLEVLAPKLPLRELVCVAESGLKRADDASRVVRLGYRAALIGTALMRSENPQEAVRAFVAAGRDV